MAKITYVEHDGTERIIDVETGLSLMEGAVRNNVPGIVAECGGACSCATCHVYVDPEWLARIGAVSDFESSMLEFVENSRPNSRLACQVEVTSALDGLVVHTPESQH